MPITRTTMIDDDGSGTTGTIIDNAWKQEFYNQIDALGVGLPIVYGTWTPIDTSGAGLTLTVQTAVYAKVGRQVFVTAYVTYPVTANAAQALLGGLPVSASHWAGFYQTYGPVECVLHVTTGSNGISLYTPTGALRTNAALSGAALIFSGVYLMP